MKIRMNLIPYRESRRKEIRKNFWMSFGFVAGVALVSVGGVHMAIAGYIASQDGRNAYIKTQNDVLEGKIKEIAVLRENIESVKKQQEIIGKLQSDRAAPAYLLDQMVRLVPDGMYLNTLKQKDSEVSVTGLAQSSEMVSSFMVSIQESIYLAKPELVEIKALTKDGRRFQQFTLKFIVRTADDAKTESKTDEKSASTSISAPAQVKAPVKIPAAIASFAAASSPSASDKSTPSGLALDANKPSDTSKLPAALPLAKPSSAAK